METLINRNQIQGANKIQVLNIIQTGSLTRDGAIINGFSSSDYCTVAARVSENILSLDSSTFSKNFSRDINNSSNWEIVFRVKLTDKNSGWQTLYTYTPGSIFGGVSCGATNIYISMSRSSQGDIFTYNITDLTEGEFYSVKVEYTGTQYIVSISSDGDTWIVKHTETSSTKINPERFIIGTTIQDNTSYCVSPIDLAKCYIKINGVYWWKGVETLTF